MQLYYSPVATVCNCSSMLTPRAVFEFFNQCKCISPFLPVGNLSYDHIQVKNV